MKSLFMYVVFAFDTECPNSFKGAPISDGYIFSTKDEANVFIRESIADQWADKFIIAKMYTEDRNKDTIQLYGVEVVGFKIKDLKKATQLKLF